MNLQRIKLIYSWPNIRLLLFVNLLISLLIILLDFSENRAVSELPVVSLYVAIIVYSVGFSIFTALSFISTDSIRNSVLRWLATIIIIASAGWTGYILGNGIIAICFNQPFSLPGNVRGIVRNSLQFLFFGALATGFFSLKYAIKKAIHKLTEREVQAEKLERLKTKAELNALRSKVNPHFLFNTLNSIASLIPTNPQKAENLIAQLSGLFRYSLQVSDEETIEEELKVVEKYLEIEKVRLDNRLSYEIQCDNQCRDIHIPGLLIQPLVENCIKHGIAPQQQGGKVVVVCSRKNGHCIIVVKDNGKGFPENHEENFGLGGVRERLQLMYGDNHAFSIENLNGVTITIRIPLNVEEDN